MLSIQDMFVFCKKKGFVFPNSEIYGGFAGFWDYGPLGVELKKNVISEWWKRFVHSREDVVGIDGAIITNPKVWKASGHVDCFVDVVVECGKCNYRLKAENLIEDFLGIRAEGLKPEDFDKLIRENKIKCPKCKGEFKKARFLQLMFETMVGPVDGVKSYLRPETAQLIFVNFRNVVETCRVKLPFGIAQVGKAFRNEISPRDFLFRAREFEQMEIEYFVHPDRIDDCPFFDEVKDMEVNVLTAKMQEAGEKEGKKMKISELVEKNIATKWHAYWVGVGYKWFVDLGINPENLRLREHLHSELAHYAGACIDIEYKFPFGWKEIYGNADRKQFDLEQHSKFSKEELSVYDQETKQKVIPYVAAEPSQGVDRTFLAFLFDAYSYDEKRGNVVLKLHPKLAPIKVAVFPLLSNKPDLVKKAREVFSVLKKEFNCFYDQSGSIGRRYARQDEIGTPFCVTIDFDSLKQEDVTVRFRDTTEQVRVKIGELVGWLRKHLA